MMFRNEVVAITQVQGEAETANVGAAEFSEDLLGVLITVVAPNNRFFNVDKTAFCRKTPTGIWDFHSWRGEVSALLQSFKGQAAPLVRDQCSWWLPAEAGLIYHFEMP